MKIVPNLSLLIVNLDSGANFCCLMSGSSSLRSLHRFSAASDTQVSSEFYQAISSAEEKLFPSPHTWKLFE